MPYIEKGLRDTIKHYKLAPINVGELNFKITTILDEYISLKGVCYSSLNDAIGVLECAKLELYRRIAAPYEDKKIDENGDVYSIKP